MKRVWLLACAAVAMAGCPLTEGVIAEEFSWLNGGDPNAEFSRRIQVIGPLDFGQTSAPAAFHDPPKYRAFTIAANPGDNVDAWVRSTDGSAVAWLLDGSFKNVAKSDISNPAAHDAHVTAVVPAGAAVSWFLVFRDRLGRDSNFTASLAARATIPAADYFSCAADADCTAVPVAGCCKNGKMIAVNATQIDNYNKANACTQPNPICPEILFVDKRVAQCDFTRKQCDMFDPPDIHCGGNIQPHHDCPTGFHCKFAGVPDVGGNCERDCDMSSLNCPPYQHQDQASCSCLDNEHCGGIAGRPCTDPAHPRCVDDPRDTCDPTKGGRDCGGICEVGCVEKVMCRMGMHFDTNKCICVPGKIMIPPHGVINEQIKTQPLIKTQPAPESDPAKQPSNTRPINKGGLGR